MHFFGFRILLDGLKSKLWCPGVDEVGEMCCTMRDSWPGRSAMEEFNDNTQDEMIGDLVGKLSSDMAEQKRGSRFGHNNINSRSGFCTRELFWHSRDESREQVPSWQTKSV